MMKTGDLPYWNENFYQYALNSDADIIIIIMEGENKEVVQNEP